MNALFSPVLVRRMLAAFAALVFGLDGRTAETATPGEIQGRVFNVSGGSYLTNARIAVKGTDLEAFTNSSGDYLLHHLPSGDVTVVVTYTGLAQQSATVTVEGGKTVRRDFDLKSARSTTTDTGNVFVAMQNLARSHLRVFKRFRHGPHPQRRHVVRLQIIFPLMRGFLHHYLLQLGRFRLEVPTAVFIVLVPHFRST